MTVAVSAWYCTGRYLEVLLRRVTMGQVVYSRNYKAFVTLTSDVDKQGFPVQSEEYADLMGTVLLLHCLSVSLFLLLSMFDASINVMSSLNT